MRSVETPWFEHCLCRYTELMFKTPDYVGQEDASDNAELIARMHGRIREVLLIQQYYA